ncbi:lipopolysaccharide assembly protein LapB [Cesiribacter sp. SM1]|uniref:tetratricopeptide repeat protein n=1 Tax=Cesiribacter sp. SM1 TaxID=2861196 RepID=UPI001CD3F77E|nr:tetratricopeptide repeat protein [Cesiribacter sp. SM1]
MKFLSSCLVLFLCLPLMLCCQQSNKFAGLDEYLAYSNKIDPQVIDEFLGKEADAAFPIGMKAYFLAEKQNQKQAKALLQKELSKRPELKKSSYIKLASAKIAQSDKDLSKYKSDLHQAIELGEPNKWAFLELYYHFKDSDSLKAISYLNEALIIDSSFSHALLEKAYQYDFNSECEKVISILGPVIEAKSEVVTQLTYLADAHFFCGNNEKAEALYIKANTIEKNKYSYQGLANIEHYIHKNYPAAKKNYEKAVSLEPENPNLKVDLAWLYFDMGEIEQANKQFGEALKQRTDDATIYNDAILFYIKTNSLNRAENLLVSAKGKFGLSHYLDGFTIVLNILRNGTVDDKKIKEFEEKYDADAEQWLLDLMAELR